MATVADALREEEAPNRYGSEQDLTPLAAPAKIRGGEGGEEREQLSGRLHQGATQIKQDEADGERRLQSPRDEQKQSVVKGGKITATSPRREPGAGAGAAVAGASRAGIAGAGAGAGAAGGPSAGASARVSRAAAAAAAAEAVASAGAGAGAGASAHTGTTSGASASAGAAASGA
eukprot:767865-Hanusia_phi.AAC.1